MFLLEHTADIKRDVALGTNGRFGKQVVKSGVECLALPMDAKSAINNNFTIGKAWHVYFDIGTELKTGDKLDLSVGKTVTVGGIAEYSTLNLPHVKAMCSEDVS